MDYATNSGVDPALHSLTITAGTSADPTQCTACRDATNVPIEGSYICDVASANYIHFEWTHGRQAPTSIFIQEIYVFS